MVNTGCAKPARLQDNLDSGYAKWVWWEHIINSPATLLQFIEDANASDKELIVNDRQRMSRNG